MNEIKNKITITILNEYDCLFSGLHRQHYDYLYEKYGIFTDKYFFHPLYKLGRWDGKKRFFSKNGMTCVNLSQDIIKTLQEFGYKNFNLVDKRKEYTIEFKNIDENYLSHKNITLGSHQVDAINAVLHNYGGIIRAGTGAGKTIITAVLCDLFNKQGFKTVVIVPNYDLVTQTKETFNRCDVDVGEYSGKLKDIDHANIIASWQAIQHNVDVLKMFTVVILDECHILMGNKILEIISQHCNHMPLKIAMTGTLPQSKCGEITMKSCFGNLVYEIAASDLIEKGWLADIEINCVELTEDFSPQYKLYLKNNKDKQISYKEFILGYFPDYSAESSYLIGNDNRNEELVKYISNISKSGNTLVILNSIKHGKKLQSMIDGSVFIYGETKTKERQTVYKSYNERDNIVHFSTFKLVQAGLDIPRIKNLVIIDAGRSYIRVIQSLGRGLRKAHDKSHINVIDIHSNLKYSMVHYKERISFYKKEKYKFKKTKIQLKPNENYNVLNQLIDDEVVDID
jgi:superfamily II DNA or RNA helicase